MPEPILIRHDKGLWLPEADLWLDPRESRERAFVSHAHSDHFAPHLWTLCSRVTRRLIGSRYGNQSQRKLHTPDWDEPYEERGHLFRLLPAGHIFGSAMLHVTRLRDGASLLYTGDFKLRQGLTSERTQLRPADTLVMETTFGLPKYRFPPSGQVIATILAFAQETLEGGGIPVLLGYSLGKAQEILAALGETELPVMLHPSVTRLARVYDELRGTPIRWKPFHAENAQGHVLIFPPSAGRSVALRKLKGVRTAMLSGWALDPGARFRYQVDKAFPLSDHADYGELLKCVEEVQPRWVYTVHGYASEFARDLRMRGWDAWSLVGENQLELTLSTEMPSVPPIESPENHFEPEDTSEAEPATDSFLLWARTCEEIAAHAPRLSKVEKLARYLRQLPESELPRATRWFTGNPGEPSLPPLQVGHAVIRQALLRLGGMNEREYRRLSQSQNDTGRTAYLVLRGYRSAEGGIRLSGTLAEIAVLFENLRQAKGISGKSGILQKALESLSPLEGSYVVRLLTGELRIGSKEGLVEEAIAGAFLQPAQEVREAVMLSGDPGQAALLARRGALAAATPTLFVPIKVMLASPEESAAAIWERLGPAAAPIWLESKYDGIRAQLHANKERIEIYSRDLKPMSTQFPEITGEAGFHHEAIFDGEIIAYDEAKRLTFHDLQRRLGRKEEADLFIRSDIAIQYVVFDLLWHNGRSLLKEPLEKRRQLLEELELPDAWQRITVHHAASLPEVESFYHAARRAGHEGLIAKDRTSFYSPGRRGKNWLKLKKTVSTLDVVVVRAELGHGKRSRVLSDYTFAVRDNAGALKVIGKAYSGLTDAEIEELTEYFETHTISQRGNVRTVSPDIVLEVAFDSIRPSQRHDSGLALRFPRIKAIRRDKTVSEIDTLEYARSLAHDGAP